MLVVLAALVIPVIVTAILIEYPGDGYVLAFILYGSPIVMVGTIILLSLGVI